MKRPLLFAAVFLWSLPLAAQSGGDPDPNDPRVKREIIVTASALPEEVATTPSSVTVITREEIERRQERDLSELLREVPGVVISRTGSEGRATSLFMRGSESTHTLVMWNGIELNNPYFGGYDWGQFSTAGVEQVEVVRGAYSALYGSDAYAGAVNVIAGNRGNDFDLDIQAGEHGLLNTLADVSFSSGRIHGNVTYDSREDDGFFENDDYDQQTLMGGLTWTAGRDFSIGIQARDSEYDLGIPFNTNAAGDALVPSLRRRQNGTELQLAIPIRHTIGRFSYDLTLSRTELDYDFADPDDPYGFTFASTESVGERARLVTRTSAGVLGTILVGGEYEDVEVDAGDAFGTTVDQRGRRNTALFIEDRFSHTFAGGSRLEVSAGVRGDDFESFGREVSPRAAIGFITGGVKWRAAYGEGFRAPSLAELYYPFLGNEELQPERSRNVEVGVDRYVSPNTSLSLTLFRSDYDELIAAIAPTFRYVNVHEVRSQGVELGARTRSGNIGAAISYTYLDAEQRETSEDRLRRPKHSGSIVLSYDAGGVTTTAAIVHSGERSDILPVFPYSRVMNEAYTRGDVTVQYRMARWTPYVRVENVTDEKYEEVLGYPSPSRRALFGLRYSIK